MDNEISPVAGAIPLYLTVSDAATLLRCSIKTIRRRIDEGELLHVRNGRRILIPQAAIRDFLGDGGWR